MTKDVISLSISVLLLFRHYISHKITFGAPSSGGVLCSACGAFIELYNTFCQALDEIKEVRAAFCDISYAFDRVWQRVLIAKLKHYGICGPLRNWSISTNN